MASIAGPLFFSKCSRAGRLCGKAGQAARCRRLSTRFTPTGPRPFPVSGLPGFQNGNGLSGIVRRLHVLYDCAEKRNMRNISIGRRRHVIRAERVSAARTGDSLGPSRSATAQDAVRL